MAKPPVFGKNGQNEPELYKDGVIGGFSGRIKGWIRVDSGRVIVVGTSWARGDIGTRLVMVIGSGTRVRINGDY